MKKPKPRSQAEVNKEIQILVDLKDKMPQRTAFGDDNREAIEAEIVVLKDNLTEQQIDDRSWFEDEGEDESKWSSHTNDSARYAYNWKIGHEKEPPSHGWKPLVKK